MGILPKESPQEKHAYNFKIQLLMTELSSHLMEIDMGDIDEIIDGALNKVGDFVDVDRSYVFIFSKDGKTASNTHEWCADGMSPQIHRLQGIPVEADSWWMRHLIKIKEICISNVLTMPKTAGKFQEKLMEQTIKALVIIPITRQGRLAGFIGFDSVRRERNWKRREIQMLRLLGELVVHVLYAH